MARLGVEIMKVSSPFLVEALALIDVVVVTSRLDLERVHIELDNLSVVNAVRGP